MLFCAFFLRLKALEYYEIYTETHINEYDNLFLIFARRIFG